MIDRREFMALCGIGAVPLVSALGSTSAVGKLQHKEPIPPHCGIDRLSLHSGQASMSVCTKIDRSLVPGEIDTLSWTVNSTFVSGCKPGSLHCQCLGWARDVNCTWMRFQFIYDDNGHGRSVMYETENGAVEEFHFWIPSKADFLPYLTMFPDPMKEIPLARNHVIECDDCRVEVFNGRVVNATREASE